MKKFLLVVAISAAFAACNNGAGTEAAKDTTKVDTTKVVIDTTKHDTTHVMVDTTKKDTTKKM